MEYISHFKSPIGQIKVAAYDNEYISGVYFLDQEDEIPNNNGNEITSKCVGQLKEYFNKERRSFDIPLSPEGTTFQKEVWKTLTTIPFGKTTTYGKLAQKLGDVKKVRAVGTANGKNPIFIVIPCHRVIGANNDLTGYAGGLWRKQWLLKHEYQLTTKQTTLF